MSARYAESVSSNSVKNEDYFLLDVATASKFHGDFTATVLELTEAEIEQIKKSRQDIGTGKARLFKNVEEYLKSLDEDI